MRRRCVFGARRSLTGRALWVAGGEEGDEDGAGAEHLRSGRGAGGARVLLLLRRNRPRRHHPVSARSLLFLNSFPPHSCPVCLTALRFWACCCSDGAAAGRTARCRRERKEKCRWGSGYGRSRGVMELGWCFFFVFFVSLVFLFCILFSFIYLLFCFPLISQLY